MKHLFAIASLLLSFAAAAQVRTYGDMETKTFVIGLSVYYFGDNGSLSMQPGTMVTLLGNRVACGGQELLADAPAGNTLIGAHDFTDDGTPELLVATRGDGMVKAQVYKLSAGAWTQIGTVGARGAVDEIRVFRQALTVKDRNTGTLYTWTWHGNRFDFKSSDGGPDPAAGL